MRIILIGFMGSGKSVSGKLIAETFGLNFKDLDTEIESCANGLSITDIFKEEGESCFRKRECSTAIKLQDEKRVVIATGGGAPLFEHTLEALRAKGSQSATTFVWLDLPFAELQKRVANTKERPLFADQKKAKRLFEHRYPLYQSIADIRICVNESESVEQVTQRIVTLIKKRKRAVIIGSDTSGSLSPRMHNAAYKKLNLNDTFFFDFASLAVEQVEGFLNQARSNNYAGVTVTIPFKEAVMPFLDTLSPEAQAIGAVNTVVVKDKKLHGYNTDWYGVIKPLQNLQSSLKGREVLVLGAGGAARAAIWGLVQQGCRVTIFNRTVAKAQALARKFSCHVIEDYSLSDYDIIINTIPEQSNWRARLHRAQKPPLDQARCNRALQIFFDMNYTSTGSTKLLQTAKDLGFTTIDGREMLLWQGVKQFELYTESKAPVEVMRESIGLSPL